MKEMTRCKYHQQEIVSFCLNVGCLLPLCSYCTPQHQAYHFQTSTQMCIVKLQQSIQAAQVQLSSMLLPLSKLRSSFHEIRSNKLQVFYDKIQKQKAKLLAKVQQQFNQMASNYIESIQISISGIKDKLQSTIMEIQNSSRGLSSGTKTIQTLVQFWINKRSLNQKVRNLQKDIHSGVGMSGTQSLNTTIMKNIQMQTQRGISSTKQLFKDVPTAVMSQKSIYRTHTQTYNYNTNTSPINNDSHYHHHGQQIEDQIEKQRVHSRISILQQQNKRILMELGQKRSSY